MRCFHSYYTRFSALSILYFVLGMLMAGLSSAQNFTNKGREFWAGYGHNHLFTLSSALNAQEMVLYLSADQPAHVTVSINGTGWTRQYTIPANTVVPSDLMPKSGSDDCRLLGEGLSTHAIHIQSDVPIVAYAHVYGQNSSGAAMLLPVESYGNTYFSLNSEQNYDPSCHSWFFVVASENNTLVRITAARATMGKAANTPFTVTLNKGELYNVMGYTNDGGIGNDMSGSKIQSIPGPDGICHPVAVFSGSSRTTICTPEPFGGGGDFIMQQVFPVSAWGRRYLTAPTSSSIAPSTLNNNKFRVYVKEPGTVVRRNGAILSPLTNNSFFEYVSSTPDYITSTKPVMVAQFIPSGTGCATVGEGDPEMFYLSPLEQSISQVTFYNTNKESIDINYLTLIVPSGGTGLSSLLIDGSNAVDYTYPHPNLPGYQVVVKQLPATAMQHSVKSDSGFTAITYGLGYVESYGYNAGCYINNLTTVTGINNVSGQSANTYTCPGTPFHIYLQTVYQPTAITWHFSRVSNISPASDITINNPVPTGTIVINGKTYNVYELPQQCTVSALGTYDVPVSIFDPQIDNCSQSEEVLINIPVLAGPAAAFTTKDVCASDSARFADASAGPGIDKWYWDFGDGGKDSLTSESHLYKTPGSFTVNLQVVRNSDGCYGNATQAIHINPMPAAAFSFPSIICMPGGISAFINQSVLAGNGALAYTWQFGDGGTATDKDPVHAYAAAGSYPVRLIANSSNGCADTVSHTLAYFAEKPVAVSRALAADICQNALIAFTDSSYTRPPGQAIDSWHWWWGDGTDAQEANPLKAWQQPGSYTIQLAVKSAQGCWSDTIENPVMVYAVPGVNAGPDMITEPNHAVVLQGTVSDAGAVIKWSPAAYLSAADVLHPLAMPPATQQFYLTATGLHNCSSMDSMLVKVYKDLKIPNAFTPNGDGHNDKWIIPGLADYPQATVDVFNRWGQTVFHSTGYNSPWDGSFKGNLLPMGAYYYVIVPHAAGLGKVSGAVLIIR